MRSRTTTAILFLCLTTPCVDGLAQQRIEAQKYAVVSGHPAATVVGLEVLRQGGNVVDAAVATSLALGVAEPYGSGLGGKLVMLYRDAQTGKVHSIVALCASPAALDAGEFTKLSDSKRKYGYKAVGVPGLIAGLHEAHSRWGSQPWNDLVEPAAVLADRGVEIDATMHDMFLPKVGSLRKDEEASQLYLVDGQAPPVGTLMRNADLANTLRDIGAGGGKAFYNGPIAERVVAASRASGGYLVKEDFEDYRAEVGEPLEIEYRGHRIYSCPPPLTGGVTVLAALECLEHMHSKLPGNNSSDGAFVQFTDQACRSLQCLYPPIRDHVADVPTAAQSCRTMLSETSAKQFARAASELDPRNPLQDPKRTEERETTLEGLPAASTSHLLVVDRAGNMVSLTQSLSLHFGASVVAPETGFLLNDSMSNFATQSQKSVNHVAAKKRARSTIAPIIVTKQDKPWLALGIPGGQRIPTTTLQLLWRVIDQQSPLEDAFAASRFHLRRPLRKNAPENVIDYEVDAPSEWVAQVKDHGWQLEPRPRDGHYFGGGGAAQYQESGTIVGVADPRRTNFAAGD
ncbi:gamma-glutamyltransferase family protein [Adhaeretor mobilis]|nr:gamma-glutamyltransferase family protein [Adhaeretor mobilis]